MSKQRTTPGVKTNGVITAAQYRAIAAKQIDEERMIESVVTFLNSNGFYAWRQQNQAHFNRNVAVTGILNLISKVRNADKHGINGRLFGPQQIWNNESIKKAIEDCLSKSWRRIPHSVLGVADVIGWEKNTGRWIAVEIKIGADQISSDQEIWLSGLRRAGGSVWVCRNFEFFVDSFWKRKT